MCMCLLCVCVVLYLDKRPCDELITRPRSPTVCKMIMKLKNQRPRTKGAVEPAKKKEKVFYVQMDVQVLLALYVWSGTTNTLMFVLIVLTQCFLRLRKNRNYMHFE
jgi:hypothetical protein